MKNQEYRDGYPIYFVQCTTHMVFDPFPNNMLFVEKPKTKSGVTAESFFAS